MTFYTRTQIVQLLEIEDSFFVQLEGEEIVYRDAPEGYPGEFSEQMLERARVADNLVHELEINLPGVAVILRMREQVATLRHHVESLASELRRRG
jgi:MerR family transcriptional regulator, heat shock protein HspR